MLKRILPVPEGSDFLQYLFSLNQRSGTQIISVEIEEIESIEDETIAPAVAKIGLEGCKIRCAGTGLNHQFAIDKRRLDRKSGELGQKCFPQTYQTSRDRCVSAA